MPANVHSLTELVKVRVSPKVRDGLVFEEDTVQKEEFALFAHFIDGLRTVHGIPYLIQVILVLRWFRSAFPLRVASE